jgi:hypothetical protein
LSIDQNLLSKVVRAFIHEFIASYYNFCLKVKSMGSVLIRHSFSI